MLTGAIRPASAGGADGPANLLDAVRAAGAEATAGAGAIVAFAGELHARARGPQGRLDVAARVRLAALRPDGAGRSRSASTSGAARTARPPLPVAQLDARVEIVPAALGSDGALLDAALAAGADGIVAVLLGAGHAPPAFLRACSARPQRASRSSPACGPSRGRILRSTYGFEGAEGDVRARRADARAARSPPPPRGSR